MSAFQPKVNHIKPVEITASLDESALALAEITAGSGRVINLLNLNGVRLDAVDVRFLNIAASATTVPAAPYSVKGFYIGSVAGDDDVVGTTDALSFNATAASETLSVSAGGRRFDKVIIGLEVTGGTTGLTADIQADVTAIGSVRGPILPLPMGGDGSFAKAGSSLAFSPTTTDFTVTVASESTAL